MIGRKVLDGIVEGRADLAFRRWDRARVRSGGRQHTAVGVLDVVDVREVTVGDITEEDALRAGAASRDALLAQQAHKDDRPMFRVELRFAGPDPRVKLRERADLGREKRPFKADVRKLKELGLTESLRVGYQLSPRGRAYRARGSG